MDDKPDLNQFKRWRDLFKTQLRDPESDRQYARYRWEFLRRNPEYIKDFENLQKKIEKSGFYPPNGPHLEEAAFCDKWRVTVPLSPYFGFNRKGNAPLPFPVSWEDDMYAQVETLFFEDGDWPPVLIYGKGLDDKNGLTVRIDLRYSKNEILKELGAILKEHHKGSSKAKPKYRFDKLDTYLKVYDLRNEGKSWAQIADAIGEDPKLGKDSAITTVRNYHQSAVTFIEGVVKYLSN
jgi:hypothetical protein